MIAAPGFRWAQRVLRRQLDTLARLTSVAFRILEAWASEPLPENALALIANMGAVEKSLFRQARVIWALGLLRALHAKLVDDQHRLEDGETPELVLGVLSVDAQEAGSPPERRSERSSAGTAGPNARPQTPDRLPRGFAEDDYTAILKRPTDEVIALICRELGLSPDWPRIAEEAWEEAEETQRPPFATRAPCPAKPRTG